MSGPVDLLIVVVALVTSVVLILLLAPIFRRYARIRHQARMRQNARAGSGPPSAHEALTPVGAGIAVLGATIGTGLLAGLLVPTFGPQAAAELAPVSCACVLMAGVGALGDLTDGRIELRFLLQAIIVAGLIVMLPHDLRALPMLPLWFERLVTGAAGLWFLNLVNFMDGIDLMTAAEVAPISLGILVIGWLDRLPASVTVVALALFGAIVGFAPFNRLGKRLFLGDVGTLPIGLLLGWMLLWTGGSGHLAASILLPLYYLADATITILKRLVRGARIWEGHQEHYYQRAIQRGFSHAEVIVSVVALNLALAALAAMSVITASVPADIAALCIGGGLVAWQLARFARGKT